MLEKCKTLLRITGTDFDVEIQDLIDACKADLKNTGILETKIESNDPLITRLISIYVKRDFGWNNEDYDNLNKAYESLKIHLALSCEYTQGVI